MSSRMRRRKLMSPTKPNNLAARMGRWSADHWKTATFGWLAFVVVAFALGGAIGTKFTDPNAPGPGESGRMDEILDAGFKQPAGESVFIQSESQDTTDPAFRTAIKDVVAGLSRLPAAQNVRPGEVSRDGKAVLVDFQIRGEADDAVDKIDPVLATVDDLQRAH